MDVLIADDNVEFAEMIGELMADEGFAVTVVHDGLQAITRLKDNDAPSIAILDNRMPGVSGHGVLSYIRSNNLDTRVLIITAFPSRQEEERFEHEGADGVLSKPVRMSRVLEVILELQAK